MFVDLSASFSSTSVIIEAIPKKGYDFNGWYDANNTKVNNNLTWRFKVTIGSNMKLKAIFGTKAEDKIRVTFKNGNGQIIQSSYVVKGSDVTFPSNPYMYGYTFNGWDKTEEEIKANMET